MTARRVLPLLLLFALSAAPRASATPTAAPPRLVRVELDRSLTAETLLEAGLDVVEVSRGSHCVILEWPGDRDRLAALDASPTVLDEHPGRSAAERARADLASEPRRAGERVLSAARADGIFRTEVLPPFGSGSFAGYWSLEEIKMKLDQWVAADANGVVADQVDTLGWSLQGRPIWGLRLGKWVGGPDSRPVAFYNALTHAREPAGMQALLYFADDLLSKYGADPMATYLLDQRWIYLVPVVNPDGYKLNQDHYATFGSFSFHRKNLRDTNGNGVADNGPDGVDINRNYGFLWGFNNQGSSGSPTDATYRGSAPFSEPETQAQRDVVALLEPKTGLSFHTWGDLYIHPWGWTSQPVPDSAAFHEWSDDLSLGNGYHAGQGPRILYEVNGEFTDWCYGDLALKPRVWAWTPEVGGPTDGFWPQASRLLPLAQENLRGCYYVAAIAGPHVRVESFGLAEGALNRGSIAHLGLTARNRGASGTAGPGLTVTLSSLSSGAHVIQGTGALPALASFQSGALLDGANLVIAADDTVTLGRLLRFQADFGAPDGFFSRDTLEVYCGTPTFVFADDADAGTSNWSTHSWGVESGDPARPGSFFADSPGGLYGNNSNRAMTLASTLDLSKAVHGYLVFQTRWEFESDADCGVVEGSRQGGTWNPLPGQSTSLARGGAQPAGAPVYDGARRNWRSERVNLAAIAGPGATSVRFRFRVLSDGGESFDGFRVDSVRVVSFDPAAQPAPVAVGGEARPTRLELAPPSPNPARGLARLSFAWPRAGRARLEVLDLMGRRVRILLDRPLDPNRYAAGWDLADQDGRPVPPGVYLVRLSGDRESFTRRIVALR